MPEHMDRESTTVLLLWVVAALIFAASIAMILNAASAMLALWG